MKISNKIRHVKIAVVSLILLTLCVLAVVNRPAEPTLAAAQPVGNWANYTSDAWLNTADDRYCGYDGKVVGDSKDYPYLISNAAELAYLGTVGESGQFAGKYIQLGTKCNETLSQIDMSAHYWTPINLYGGENGSVFLDDVAAHFDGNNVRVIGLNIKNTYTEAHKMVFSESYAMNSINDPQALQDLCGSQDFTNGNFLEQCEYKNGFTNGAAVGLFGEIYKVQLTNMRLDAPVIELTEHSDVCSEFANNNTWGIDGGFSLMMSNLPPCGSPEYESGIGQYHYGKNLRRIEVVGSLVGTSRYSMIIGNAVEQPNINVAINPINLMVGGLIGYTAGFNYVVTAASNGGQVDVKYVMDLNDAMVIDKGAGIKVLQYGYTGSAGSNVNYGTVAVGGLIGANYHGAVMNGYSSTNVKFDSTHFNDYWQNIVSYINQNYSSDNIDGVAISPFNANLMLGGLVGYSNDVAGIAACILNSFASGDVELILPETPNLPSREALNSGLQPYFYGGYQITTSGALWTNIGIGGVAGFLYDTAANNYFGGRILVNGREGANIPFATSGTLDDSGTIDQYTSWETTDTYAYGLSEVPNSSGYYKFETNTNYQYLKKQKGYYSLDSSGNLVSDGIGEYVWMPGDGYYNRENGAGGVLVYNDSTCDSLDPDCVWVDGSERDIVNLSMMGLFQSLGAFGFGKIFGLVGAPYLYVGSMTENLNPSYLGFTNRVGQTNLNNSTWNFLTGHTVNYNLTQTGYYLVDDVTGDHVCFQDSLNDGTDCSNRWMDWTFVETDEFGGYWRRWNTQPSGDDTYNDDTCNFDGLQIDGSFCVWNASVVNQSVPHQAVISGYTVANNFYHPVLSGNLPGTPSLDSWRDGDGDHDAVANHVAPMSANLLGDLNGGLSLVAQMIARDLGALTNDPALQAQLIGLGQSLISDWVNVGGQPVLRVLTLNPQPVSRTCPDVNQPDVNLPDTPGSTAVIPGVPNTGRL